MLRLRLNNIFLFWIVAWICSGCLDRAFYVDTTVPADLAENVSRTTPITVTVVSDGVLTKDQLTADYFYLEELGKDYDPNAKTDDKAAGDKTKTPDSTTKTGTKSDDGKKGDKSSTETTAAHGDKPKVVIYALPPSYGVGKEKTQIRTVVVVAAVRPLKARVHYRLNVSHELQDSKNNVLLSDHTVTFKTGSFPEEVEAKLTSLEPRGLTPVPASDVPATTQQPPAVTPPTAPPKTETNDDEAADDDSEDAPETDNDGTIESKVQPVVGPRLETQGMFYVHPDQNFMLMFSAPVNFENIRKWLTIKREKNTQYYSQDATFSYRLLSVDDIKKPEERMRRFIVEPEQRLVGNFILSFIQAGKANKFSINLIGDDKKAEVVPFPSTETQRKLGLDDFKVVEDDEE